MWETQNRVLVSVARFVCPAVRRIRCARSVLVIVTMTSSGRDHMACGSDLADRRPSGRDRSSEIRRPARSRATCPRGPVGPMCEPRLRHLDRSCACAYAIASLPLERISDLAQPVLSVVATSREWQGNNSVGAKTWVSYRKLGFYRDATRKQFLFLEGGSKK